MERIFAANLSNADKINSELAERSKPMTQYRPFGNSGLELFPLGLGTIWFGRQWPPNNTSYQYPSSKEISDHLMLAYTTMGNHDGIVTIDTAAAYGDGEVRIGEFLRDNPAQLAKSFIATKWGEDFDVANGVSTVDHSVDNLHRSFERSLRRLGKIDLLYIHKTNSAVLSDEIVIEEMVKIKQDGSVRLLGVSISDASTLREAVEGDLLEPFDVIQMPAPIFFEQFDSVKMLHEARKAIVINSPIRKSNGADPKTSYSELLKKPEASLVLTGTRTHLAETVRYMYVE